MRPASGAWWIAVRQTLILFGVLCVAVGVYGQETANDNSNVTDQSAGSRQNRASDAKQRLVESLIGRPMSPPPPGVPPFSISTITAEGRVDERHVQLEVEFLVVVHDDGEWVQVPLELPSWQIRDFEEQKGSKTAESVFPADASDKRIWYLRGKGEHRLTMNMIGDVRSPEPGRRRIRLSLPQALISSLKLSFAEPIESAPESNAKVDGVDEIPGQELPTFQFWGLKPETEVNWQPATPAGETATVVRMREPAQMELDLRARLPQLTCKQNLRVTGGTIDRLEIQLPVGYGNVAVSGRDENGVLIIRPGDVSVNEARTSATIRFREPVRGDISLVINLGVTNPEYLQEIVEIVVSIPAIDSIDEQEGHVEILIPRGLEVTPLPGLLTHQASVKSSPDTRHAAYAWDLMSAKSELRLSVSEIAASFGVEPQLEISTSTNGQSLLMLARFPVNVSQGSVDEILVDWPRFADDGWRIAPQTTRLVNEEGTVPIQSPVPIQGIDQTVNRLRLTLGDYQSGSFVAEFRAIRDLQDSEVGTHQFSLPDVEDSTGRSTSVKLVEVKLVESDSHSLTLSPIDNQTPIPSQQPDQLADPQQRQRSTSWLVQAGSRVRIRQTPQTSEVTSTAVIALEPHATQESIHVHSEFLINVRHSDLNELRMTVPAELTEPQVRLNDNTERMAAGRMTGNEMVWPLPEDAQRQLRVVVDYLWTPQRLDGRQSLPLVLPAQGLESFVVGTDYPELVGIQMEDQLQPIFSPQFRAAWHSHSSRSELPVNLSSSQKFGESNAPTVAVVQTQVKDSTVLSTTTGIYATAPHHVMFSIPSGSSVTSVTVNGISLSPQDINRVMLESAATSELWRVPVSTGPVSGTARVSLAIQTHRSPHHHLVSTETVSFATLVDVPKWLPTIWIVGASEHTQLAALDRVEASVLRPAVLKLFSTGQSQAPPAAVEMWVADFPADIQLQVRQLLNRTSRLLQPSLIYVSGPELQVVSLLVFSRAASWLLTAVLTIVIYLLLVGFGGRWDVVALSMVVAAALFWFVTPLRWFDLVFPVIPALGLALLAWTLRLLLNPSRPSRQNIPRRSVFVPTKNPESHGSVPSAAGSQTEAAVGV